MDRTKTTVRIMGKEYAMVSNDSEEYVQKVASIVDRRMKELNEANSNMQYAQLAVLTALNVTDDMMKALEENAALRRKNQAAEAEMKYLKDELMRLKGDSL